MRRLGLHLKIREDVINTTLYDHRDSITEAAYNLLRYWSHMQYNSEDAYTTLGRSLIDCELKMIAREILDYPPIEGSTHQDTDGEPLSKKVKNFRKVTI